MRWEKQAGFLGVVATVGLVVSACGGPTDRDAPGPPANPGLMGAATTAPVVTASPDTTLPAPTAPAAGAIDTPAAPGGSPE